MIALIDCRADAPLLSALEECGFEPILMPPADYLQSGVASHTDMLIFIGFGRLFCHARYFESHKELINRISALSNPELVLSSEPTGMDYPNDVLFNACIVGQKLICNKKTVSKYILDTAEANNYEIINVPQGYTKCSVCIVSDNAIITADKSIAKACKAADIDVLTVSEGHISLPPYDHGFIGGASGLCGNTVYFCGSLDHHPDAEEIREFCCSHGKNVISLSEHQLLDVGTLFFI